MARRRRARELGAACACVDGSQAADWPALADEWRGGYQPAMQRVRSGELQWTNLDALHRMILDPLLARHGIALPEAEMRHLNNGVASPRPVCPIPWPASRG